MPSSMRELPYVFQSTLSVRRATEIPGKRVVPYTISIHALREESDFGDAHIIAFLAISIHALREESDRTPGHAHHFQADFNPRSP